MIYTSKNFFAFNAREIELAEGNVHAALILNFVLACLKGKREAEPANDKLNNVIPLSYSRLMARFPFLTMMQARTAVSKLLKNGTLVKSTYVIPISLIKINAYSLGPMYYSEMIDNNDMPSGVTDNNAELDITQEKPDNQADIVQNTGLNRCQKRAESLDLTTINNSINNKLNKKEEREIGDKVSPPPVKILQLYNSIVEEKGVLPKANLLNSKRARDIANTTASLFKTIEAWETYFHSIYQSGFLLGQNDRQWRATFDWLVNTTNANKVYEGSYFKGTGSSVSKKEVELAGHLKNIFKKRV